METDEITQRMAEYFKSCRSEVPEERKIIIRTGVMGMDLVNEMFEKEMGFERVYAGNKILRILRRPGVIFKTNPRGRNYRLLKIR